jgi:deoxyribodipyrimidine photo-lyase
MIKMAIDMKVNSHRAHILRDDEYRGGAVVYWMSRDQRAHDNWALLYAEQLADQCGAPLGVVFCLSPKFLDAGYRQYAFMLDGLKQLERTLAKLNIPLFLLIGKPEYELPGFVEANNIGMLIADFSPLKLSRYWKQQVLKRITIPFHEVDAHNIVPVWKVSEKQEFAAYTIRPKINRILNEHLEDFPSLKKHKHAWPRTISPIDWDKASKSLKADRSVSEISWLKPGESAALKHLRGFLDKRLPDYNDNRNDPNQAAQSDLSPYLHFGQLSAQRVALEVSRYDKHIPSQEAFLEELIIRRELADNFCYYNDNYDSFTGFPDWAKKTLNEHRRDKRQYLYSSAQFESAGTHDPLWNAAQLEMVINGKMHGYMRMYWAKKILEWSKTPEEAMSIAIYLNDKYELDGRDPNGYAGIAWSIGGVHDRAWPERPVFGKIRYMNYAGAKRKFSVDNYIERIAKLRGDR